MQLFISAEKSEPVEVKFNDDVTFKVAQLDLEQRRFIMQSKHFQSENPMGNGYWAIRQKIKYAIKDWKGLKDQKGNEIKCELTLDGKELKDSLWVPLVEREDVTFAIYNVIAPFIELTEEEKKS
jgi:hypothetical protein